MFVKTITATTASKNFALPSLNIGAGGFEAASANTLETASTRLDNHRLELQQSGSSRIATIRSLTDCLGLELSADDPRRFARLSRCFRPLL